MSIEEIIKTLEGLHQRYENVYALLDPKSKYKVYYRNATAALKGAIALLSVKEEEFTE